MVFTRKAGEKTIGYWPLGHGGSHFKRRKFIHKVGRFLFVYGS
jgi:hypothetical protein